MKLKLAFSSRWPITDTMKFERSFHSNLRLSLRDKRDLLREALVVWLYEADRGFLIGETYGVRVTRREVEVDPDEAASDMRPFIGRKAIYVYSAAILPRFRGQGLSKVLKANFLGRAVGAGFELAIGHAQEGASLAVNEHFGAVRGRKHADWCGTGSAYWFYSLPLR